MSGELRVWIGVNLMFNYNSMFQNRGASRSDSTLITSFHRSMHPSKKSDDRDQPAAIPVDEIKPERSGTIG